MKRYLHNKVLTQVNQSIKNCQNEVVVSNATVCFKQPVLYTAECSIHFSSQVESRATLGKRRKIRVCSLQEKWTLITSCDRVGKQYFWRRVSGSVRRTSGNRTGRHRSTDVLHQSRSSAFYHRPKVLPLSTKWARYFWVISHFVRSHQSHPHLQNLLHWKHSCPFQARRLFFLVTGLLSLRMWLQKSDFYLEAPTEAVSPPHPSAYPALRPAPHLSPVLGCTCWSRSAAASTRLPWNYATDRLQQ